MWFQFPYQYPIFSTLPYNINLLLEVKYLKIGTFSDFDAIFFVKCFNKIISLPTYPKFLWHEIGTTYIFHLGLMRQFDPNFDLKVNICQHDLYFMV